MIRRAIIACFCVTLFACNNETNSKIGNNDPNNNDPDADMGGANNNADTGGMNDVTPTNATDCTHECAAVGTSCNGNNSVVCIEDANGCRVIEQSVDCAAQDQVCDPTLGCVDPMACTDEAACAGRAADETFCEDDDTLITCALGADGCLDAVATSCATAGGTCDSTAVPAACAVACTDDVGCEGATGGELSCSADFLSSIECVDTNADGCFEAIATPCPADSTCSDLDGMCAPSCAASVQVLTCADAGMTINGDTTAGSDLLDSSACSSLDYSGPEIVYTFVPGAVYDATFTIDFDGLSNDLDLSAVSGGACTDTTIMCDDSSASTGDQEVVVFPTDAATTYYIVVDGFGGDVGAYTLSIECAVPVCGNGLIESGESCDDMNTSDTDGCDANCATETDYVCTGEPSVCVLDVCGDGIIAPTEECDDMNTMDGDGCSLGCTQEVNWECTGEPSICVENVCGDGAVTGLEECDDMNMDPGDGCDAFCNVEFGFDCDMTGCTPWPTWTTISRGMTPSPLSGTNLAAGESDWYSFTVSGQIVVLDCFTTSVGLGDTDLAVHDNGFIAGFRDAGDEAFNDLRLPPGDYYLEVYNFGPGDQTSYTLDCQVEPTDLGSFASGDTAFLDPAVDFGLDPLDNDTDWYTFTVTTPLTAIITTSPNDINDAFTWQILAADESPGLLFDGSGSLPLGPGDYFLIVDSPGQPTIDSYQLDIVTVPQSFFNIGSFSAGDDIPDPSGGSQSTGQVSYLGIEFLTDVVLDTTLDGWTMGDMDLFLLGPDGAVVAESVGVGPGVITQQMLPSGDYFFVLRTPMTVDAHGLTLDIQ